MSKLIFAGLMRLRKSRLFWAVTGALAAIHAIVALDHVQNSTNFEWILFDFMPYFCFVEAGFVSLFLGTEYSDGTMRNKIAVGHTRAAVYGANLVVSVLACLLFQMAMFAVVCAIGLCRMGTISDPLATAFFMLCALLACIAFAALFTALTMANSHKAGATVVAFCAAFLLVFAAAQIQDLLDQPASWQSGPITIAEDGTIRMEQTEVYENPNYIPDGPVRDTLTALVAFMPSGQAIGLAELYSRWVDQLPDAGGRWYWPVCSILFALIVTTAGLQIFKRKDIK